jgi:hypothetical protein
MVIFNLFYGIGDIYVLYAAPALLAFVWVGTGVGAIAELVSRGLPHRRKTIAWVGAVVPIAAIAFTACLLTRNLPRVDQRRETHWNDRWRALLASSPEQDAILVSNDRDEIMPLWYLQQVEGTRPDLTGLFPLIVEGGEWDELGQVIDQALSTHRPVFLNKPMSGLEVKYTLN